MVFVVITESHVFWIAVQMVYATTVRRRCDADARSPKAEINAKMVSIIFEIKCCWFAFLHFFMVIFDFV